MDKQTDNIEPKPKYLAQKCPVCNGFGTLKWGTLMCQGCGGKGYVLVPTIIEEEMERGRDYGNTR